MPAPNKKWLILALLAGLVGSAEVANREATHAVLGGVEGPQAAVAGIVLMLFSIVILANSLDFGLRPNLRQTCYMTFYLALLVRPQVWQLGGIGETVSIVGSFVLLYILAGYVVREKTPTGQSPHLVKRQITREHDVGGLR